MKLTELHRDFTVCKLPCPADADLSQPFTFVAYTDDECSLVCETKHVPATATPAEHGWRGLKIDGMLDFGMVGVIAKISTLLAQAKISIFVVSTYNTDYVFVKEGSYGDALRLLREDGYEVG